MVKKIIKVSILAVCVLAIIYLIFGRTIRRWLTPLDTVVGRVGEETITLKDVNAGVDYTWIIINGSSRAAYESVLGGESISEMNSSTLDYCINSKLFLQKAEEMGLYPLSEKDRIVAIAMAELYYEMNAARFKQAGVSKEDLIRIETEKKASELLKEEISKNIIITDAEVEERYESLLAEQEDRYTQNPGSYQTSKYVFDKECYPVNYTIIVYRPEEFRVVKHIMIPFPHDVLEQTLTGPYKEKDELKKLINENLPKIQAQADEVLAKARAGEDFDVIMNVLMMFYSPFGSQENHFYMDSEYELGDCISSFHTELKEAAFALKNVGDMTGLVATENGYHILKWVGNVPAGPIPFEEVKDAIKAELLEKKKSTAWSDAVKLWKDETVIEKYPDRIP